MPDQPHSPSFASQGRVRIALGVLIIAVIAVGAWFYLTAARESTDDAQVDAHVTPIASRVGGTIQALPIADNQHVEAGTVLVQLDPRDYEIAVAKARAELLDAEASARAAQSTVPVTSATTTGTLSTAQGSVEQSQAGIDQAQKELEQARARLVTAKSRVREVEANATKTARDVERLRGLLAKDEVAQQQFDAAVAAADVQRAAVDTAKSQITEAEAGIQVAEGKLMGARAGEQQARAGLKSAQSGPEQVAAMRARAASAEARAQQAKASLDQAEMNLQYTVIKAPVKGTISRKTAELGQVIQPGQPLMALIPLDTVWVTANFKETQLRAMRPGQRVTITVDAYGGREYSGHIDSLSAATGARFSLLPPENATGNYVKVVQRVPVKIVLESGQDSENVLRPGMSVAATVYTK
ncbi:MAG: HlyD family secretion protein [Acidobacteriota bacterium]